MKDINKSGYKDWEISLKNHQFWGDWNGINQRNWGRKTSKFEGKSIDNMNPNIWGKPNWPDSYKHCVFYRKHPLFTTRKPTKNVITRPRFNWNLSASRTSHHYWLGQVIVVCRVDPCLMKQKSTTASWETRIMETKKIRQSLCSVIFFPGDSKMMDRNDMTKRRVGIRGSLRECSVSKGGFGSHLRWKARHGLRSNGFS